MANITKEYLEKLNLKRYIESELLPVINIFWDRYNKRYFNQIAILKNHSTKDIRTNCGFLMTSIDCILIETLEQFYEGRDETKGSTQNVFYNYFQRDSYLRTIIRSKQDAGKFAGFVRSGLLHQSKTKQESKINIKKESPILDWIDKDKPSKGFILNRTLFHEHVKNQFEIYIEKLKDDKEVKHRTNFIAKMKTLI